MPESVVCRWNGQALAVRAAVGAVIIAAIAASALYVRPRTLDPQTAWQQGLEAVRARRPSEIRRAAEALENVPEFAGQHRFLRGALLAVLMNHEAALHDLAASQAIQEARPLCLVLSGECLVRLKRYREAERVLTTAAAETPDDVEAHRWLAILHYDSGAVRKALVHLARVADLDPADARPHRLIGLILKDNEQFAEAAAAYRESLARDPAPADLQELLVELAEALSGAREFAQALETLSRADSTADVETLRGECLAQLGRPQEARAAADAALGHDAAHPGALALSATLALDEGDVESAAATLERAVALHPRDYLLRYQYALALDRAGKSDEAARQRAILEPLRQKRLRFSELHDKAAADPDDAGVRFELGLLAREIGRPELARMWLQAALAIEPQHAAASRALEALAAEHGE